MSLLNQCIHNHWFSHCALKTIPALALSMRDVSQNLNSIKVSEHALEAGKFTHLALTSAIKYLRRIVHTPIQLFRSDFPSYNFHEMLNIIDCVTPSYIEEKDVYTHFSLASPFVQSYPNDFMNIVYASQIFSSISASIHAEDTIFASLSQDKAVLQARMHQADLELKQILQQRHKELITGGRLVIDLAGEVTYYNKSIFKLINDAIESTVKNGYLNKHILSCLTYPTHYRTYSELEDTLNSLQYLYKILQHKEEIVPAPFYEAFKIEGSRVRYADQIMNYWSSAIDMILKLAKQSGDLENVENEEKVLQEIARFVFLNVQMEPPVSEIKTHIVVLEKI